MVHFNQDDKSKTSETNNSQDKAGIARPTGSVEQTIEEYGAVVMLVCRSLGKPHPHQVNPATTKSLRIYSSKQCNDSIWPCGSSIA